jgi:anti-sigma B factor antagonist
MELMVSSHESAELVHMPEKLTAQNASEIAKTFADLIEAGKIRLVLDMSGLSFTDSSGLAVLVSVYKKAKQNSGCAILLSPQPSVMSLLELTRVQKLFEVFQERDAAIRRANDA